MEEKGAWTRALIPDVRRWVDRRHGELSYELTQALTGHGCFRSYLHKYRRRRDPACVYCGEEDTPSHTLFRCQRWEEERRRCPFWEDLREDRMVGCMLSSREAWGQISHTIGEIMRTKEEEERRTEREAVVL